ncbi:DUF4233 domain-containing protein [Corynebacterium epidermidicanis]|uniref:Putative DUF4233 family protein n=1 Tax=Corynebacterium epidermidicanis TaxID=1050174 RepID=A0A0G3GY79_9CORY|nr:DUF4233 domain-containing protein [Corynebacterium epidermidicanis]AKK03787.1 putative DUF4233 family protein [Corynebacterium epidermidicanis]
MSKDVEYGPLGPGHAPAKDPMKGLRGVMAGTLVLESIALLLILTVIAKVDSGEHWTTFNWVFVTVLGVFHFLWAFVQKQPYALPVNIALQVIAVVGGFFVHYSAGIMGLIFAAVWFYILILRKNLIERMRRGLLTTQHT